MKNLTLLLLLITLLGVFIGCDDDEMEPEIITAKNIIGTWQHSWELSEGQSDTIRYQNNTIEINETEFNGGAYTLSNDSIFLDNQFQTVIAIIEQTEESLLVIQSTKAIETLNTTMFYIRN